MHVCVIGSGYVGLVTGACFAEFGVSVTCADIDEKKIEMLNQGRIPIYEPGLEEMVAKNSREGRLQFTSDIAGAISRSLVVFIAVGTPEREDGSCDLSYVEAVARTIAENLNGYKVVVTKSTVPVGTGARIRQIIERCSGDCSFDIVSNPEFLREGSAIEDFMRPNRVIIGADSDQAAAIMKDLYEPLYLIETPIIITNVPTSEMIKYASNAFLAVKISFINEMANLCEKVGADVHMVAKGMGMDRRIGAKFLHPGPGYGGSCFPKDTKALAMLADEQGYDFQIVNSVIAVNEQQRLAMVDKITAALGGSVDGKTIGCLGLTFKPNTDDVREAPALTILGKLMSQGATVKAFDPAGMEPFARELSGVIMADDAYGACQGADCLVLMTEWNQFRNLDLDRVKELMVGRVMVDLRNVYDPVRMRQAGFEFYCVGRPGV